MDSKTLYTNHLDAFFDEVDGQYDNAIAAKDARITELLDEIQALENEVADLKDEVATLKDRIDELENPVDPPTPPTPTTKALLGVYSNQGDSWVKTNYGVVPDLGRTFYLQPKDQDFGTRTSGYITQMKAQVDAGQHVIFTITSKGTQTTAGLASGDATAVAWAKQYANSVKIITDYATSKGKQVFADYAHEWEVGVNQGSYTGESAVPETYAKAWKVVRDLVYSVSPKTNFIWWFGHSDSAKIDRVGNELVRIGATVDWIAFDPYSGPGHPASETWEQTVGNPLKRIKGTSWFTSLKPKVGLGEYGNRHKDEEMEPWYTDIRTHANNLGISFAMYFASDDKNVVVLTKATYPKATDALIASLKS